MNNIGVSLPKAAADEALASGRLVLLDREHGSRFGQPPQVAIVAVHRQDEPLVPAGRWFFDRLGGRTC